MRTKVFAAVAGAWLATAGLAAAAPETKGLEIYWIDVEGVAALAGRLPIGRFYDHGFPGGNPSDVDAILRAAYQLVTQGRSTVLHAGDEIQLRQLPGTPAIALRVVSSDVVVGEAPGSPQTRPCNAQPAHRAIPDDTSDNFRSVGLRLSFGGFEFVDLGDLTWTVEHPLARPQHVVGVIDVYQGTHHGNDNSNNPALVAALAPTVAVIDNGARKGGTAAVYKLLRATPSLKDVFQLHRNVATTPADNAPPELTANDDEACTG